MTTERGLRDASGGTVMAEPLRVPKELTLVLVDNTVIAGLPIIERIVCDANDGGCSDPEYNWCPEETAQFGRPKEFRLDENGRLFTSEGGETWRQWQFRLATLACWPPKSGREQVKVTAFFGEVKTRIAVLTSGDLSRIRATPPSPAA